MLHRNEVIWKIFVLHWGARFHTCLHELYNLGGCEDLRYGNKPCSISDVFAKTTTWRWHEMSWRANDDG